MTRPTGARAVGIDIGCMSDYMVGLKTRMVNDLL